MAIDKQVQSMEALLHSLQDLKVLLRLIGEDTTVHLRRSCGAHASTGKH